MGTLLVCVNMKWCQLLSLYEIGYYLVVLINEILRWHKTLSSKCFVYAINSHIVNIMFQHDFSSMT